jgi:hypothetical protein
MTEQEWESADRPWPLWYHVADQDLLTDRKRQLFAVAACRRVQHLLHDTRSRRIVEVCEAFADGEADFDAFCEASLAASRAARELEASGCPGEERLAASAAKWLSPDETKLHRAAEFAGEAIGFMAISRAGLVPADVPLNEALAYWQHPVFVEAMADEEHAQADLIRELFRRPFGSVPFRGDWRTSTVLALAGQVYANREWSLLPILADALQDAGCEDEQILAHCRDANGTHVRGCWAVDLVLGKS